MRVRVHVGLGSRLAAVGALVLAASACGGETIQFEGTTVGNAESVLSEADDAFDELTEAGVSAGTTTVAEESRCYFRRTGEDDIDTSVYCGPLRQLGAADDESWYPIALVEDGSNDDGVRLAIEPDDQPAPTAISSAELFRPDGNEPVAADSLDEPQAPEAPAADFAVFLPEGDAASHLEFEDLDEEYRLITPAMTLTVTAAATTDVIPREAVAAQDDSYDAESESTDGVDTPYFRPVDGQQVAAWQVTIGPPPETTSDTEASYFSDGDARSATTAISLAAGSQRLSLHGAVGDASDDDAATFTVGCSEVPCSDIEQRQRTLLASFADDADPALVATVDGSDQVLSLEDGSLTSDVSQVAYTRETRVQQVSTTWPTTTFTIRTEEQLDKDQEFYCCEDVTYTFGGEIQQVFLTPFDYAKGWAPAGQAWLTVPIANRPDELADGYARLNMDETKSMTLTIDGQSLSPQADAGQEDWVVFLVDDTFTEGTLTYSPVGSAKIDSKTYPVKTDKPLTLDITIP